MLDFSVTFVITIINIVILYLILRTILFKPVTKFMAERAKRIQDSIEQSEKDKTQAKAMLAQYEAQLKAAEIEAEAILHTAREHATQEAEKIIAESRVSAEAVLASARKQLDTERHVAMAAFKKEAAALVVAASGRLVGREINSEDSKHYADLLIDELSPDGDASALSQVIKN